MSILDKIEKRLLEIFDPTRLQTSVEVTVRRFYNKGIDDFDKQFVFSTNIVPNKEVIDFISQYTFDLVKGMTDDLRGKLQQELARGLMNGESRKQLRERIIKVMNVGVQRAEAIARTETARAYNTGQHEAAKQSGLKLYKVWYNPAPKTDVCKALKDKKVPMGEKFSYKGEFFDTPPAHVNCRSRILYEQAEETA